jgi:hypothetical protein
LQHPNAWEGNRRGFHTFDLFPLRSADGSLADLTILTITKPGHKNGVIGSFYPRPLLGIVTGLVETPLTGTLHSFKAGTSRQSQATVRVSSARV